RSARARRPLRPRRRDVARADRRRDPRRGARRTPDRRGHRRLAGRRERGRDRDGRRLGVRIGRFSGALPLVLMTVLILAVGAFATVRQDAFLTSFNLNNLLLL